MGRMRSLAATAFAFAFAATAAFADTTVVGTIRGTNSGKPNTGVGSFTCFGMPTCTGSVTVNDQGGDCSNAFTWSSTLTFTGLDLSHPGSLSGTAAIAQDQTHTSNPDGTCTYQLEPTSPSTYTGTWDGSHGSLTIANTNGQGQSEPLIVTFTANVAAAPVFQMTVSGGVTPTTTSASATLQTRPQDQGTPENIYVFAHAPSNLVAGFKRVDGPALPSRPEDSILCVLAQVTSSGQLVAVTDSTMQAALSNVVGSQQQSVTLLNNVSTQTVAGAAVYVGYGTSAAAMLASGVYQSALSVPGGVQCTASLASAPAPASAGPLSGLWWNANESGWGIHFTQRRDILFVAWYTYDATGKPKWYVASNCNMPSGTAQTATTGTCSGTLYEVHGPVFFGATFNPQAVTVTTAGSLSITFQGSSTASLTYTVAGQTRTVPIVRQVFQNGSTPPAVDYTDLWYNASESGWGMAMSHQFGVMFLAWYVYDATGSPTWYVVPSCTVSGSSCSGSIYRTTGPAFGPTFDPTKVQAILVGSAIVSFIDANDAVLSYTVDGVSGTKTIARQVF